MDYDVKNTKYHLPSFPEGVYLIKVTASDNFNEGEDIWTVVIENGEVCHDRGIHLGNDKPDCHVYKTK